MIAVTLSALLILASGPASRPVVIDGDTFDIGRERIRIANIDAPETARAKCPAERLLGIQAKGRLVHLLASGKVKIVRGDPADGRLKDRHGRTLAIILVDDRDVGEILVAEGLARPWQGRRQPWCS